MRVSTIRSPGASRPLRMSSIRRSRMSSRRTRRSGGFLAARFVPVLPAPTSLADRDDFIFPPECSLRQFAYNLPARAAQSQRSTTMRVVVIGGTGHIGSYLVPRFFDAGHEVTIVSRRQAAPYRAHSAWTRVDYVDLDRAQEEAARGSGLGVRGSGLWIADWDC